MFAQLLPLFPPTPAAQAPWSLTVHLFERLFLFIVNLFVRLKPYCSCIEDAAAGHVALRCLLCGPYSGIREQGGSVLVSPPQIPPLSDKIRLSSRLRLYGAESLIM